MEWFELLNLVFNILGREVFLLTFVPGIVMECFAVMISRAIARGQRQESNTSSDSCIYRFFLCHPQACSTIYKFLVICAPFLIMIWFLERFGVIPALGIYLWWTSSTIWKYVSLEHSVRVYESEHRPVHVESKESVEAEKRSTDPELT